MLKIVISSLLAFGIHYATMAQQTPVLPISGKDLFQNNCTRCHGKDGTKRFLGATNLRKSALENTAVVTMIQNGKRFMPSYKNKLTEAEIKELAAYVKTLRP